MRFPQSPRNKIGHTPVCTSSNSTMVQPVPVCDNKPQFASLKCELDRTLPYLPKHHLVEVRKMVMQQFRKRFQRSRIPKYGALNKGFTEQEIQKFFRAVDNDKFRLLFQYQSQLGLRIGEATRLNVKDIKFETRELVVKTEKAGTLDQLLIAMALVKIVIRLMNLRSTKIPIIIS